MSALVHAPSTARVYLRDGTPARLTSCGAVLALEDEIGIGPHRSVCVVASRIEDVTCRACAARWRAEP